MDQASEESLRRRSSSESQQGSPQDEHKDKILEAARAVNVTDLKAASETFVQHVLRDKRTNRAWQMVRTYNA